MYANLSSAEIDTVIRALAQRKGVPFPGTLHDRRQGFIIENFTWRETERYLRELERRKRLAQPLVRDLDG